MSRSMLVAFGSVSPLSIAVLQKELQIRFPGYSPSTFWLCPSNKQHNIKFKLGKMVLDG
jgi:hypothetical protein